MWWMDDVRTCLTASSSPLGRLADSGSPPLPPPSGADRQPVASGSTLDDDRPTTVMRPAPATPDKSIRRDWLTARKRSVPDVPWQRSPRHPPIGRRRTYGAALLAALRRLNKESQQRAFAERETERREFEATLRQRETDRVTELAEVQRDACGAIERLQDDLRVQVQQTQEAAARELAAQLRQCEATHAAERQAAQRLAQEQIEQLEESSRLQVQLTLEAARHEFAARLNQREASLSAELLTVRASVSDEVERVRGAAAVQVAQAHETTRIEFEKQLQQCLAAHVAELAEVRRTAGEAVSREQAILTQRTVQLAVREQQLATLSEQLITETESHRRARAGWEQIAATYAQERAALLDSSAAVEEQSQQLAAELRSFREEHREIQAQAESARQQQLALREELTQNGARYATELESLRAIHASELREQQATWQRQMDVADQEAARLRESDRADFTRLLEQRETQHQAALSQARAVAEAIEIRARQGDADRDTLRQQLDDFASRMDQSTQSLQAKADELEHLRAAHAEELAELRRLAAENDSQRQVELAALRAAAEVQTAIGVSQADSLRLLQQQLDESVSQVAEERERWQRAEAVSRDALHDTELLEQRTRDLLIKLQREATGRRKAESALMREAAAPECKPHVRQATQQLDTQREIEQLRQQVLAARNFERYLQRKFCEKIRQLQNEIEQLRQASSGNGIQDKAAA